MREKKEKKKKKYPRPHIQVQRGLAVQIMNLGLFNEFEFVNGEKIPIIYNLSDLMRSLNYDPAVFIPKLLKNGYLVIKDLNPESYYIFTSKKKGLEFKKKLNKWP